MTKLTSRPDPLPPIPTKYDLLEAAKPAVNILTWVSQRVVYPDDSSHSISTAFDMIEEALECLMLPDFVVMAAPSPSYRELHYDVAVKPLRDAPFVSFKVIFRVQP